MAKTIKQIADELGLSKQRVYRYIKNNHINESYQRNGVMYFDEVAESRIKSGFSILGVSDDVHHEAHHDVHHRSGAMHFNEAAESRVKSGFSALGVSDDVHHEAHHEAHHDAHQNGSSDTVYDVLKQQIDLLDSQFQVKDEIIKDLMAQLSVKDKQILEQSEQLKNMTIALNKSQQALQDTTAALTAALNAAQTLHAGTIGTIQKQLDSAAENVPAEETVSVETAEIKKGFWSRLFHRKK